MKKLAKIFLTISLVAVSIVAEAKNTPSATPPAPPKSRAGCTQATQFIDLDINNVRSTLRNGGDMWWDGDQGNGRAKYEVPKNSGKTSLFAGACWIAGYASDNGKLKVAAQTFRAGGAVDYWSGPLDANANVDAQTCSDWDRFWKINASDVKAFRELCEGLSGVDLTNCLLEKQGEIPQVIKEWPAAGSNTVIGNGSVPLVMTPGRTYAPFIDNNADGKYNYLDGDYPDINGDQYIWWVFNDKGNAKTFTNTDNIGLEIQTSAFAFSTADCLNEATFINYKIINRGNSTFDSTYMATWTDADLGNYADDYIGCDVNRSLGIMYNADAFDEGVNGYGYDIPMVGVDFFVGPSILNANLEVVTTLGMTGFTWFNSGTGAQGDPTNGLEVYRYMTGKWKDGQTFVLSCDNRTGSTPMPFAFPVNPGTFRECAPCKNLPGDRRFVHSSGPFRLYPGVANDITIGATWVPKVGGNCASFSKIQACDDKLQKLFKDKFKIKFGPQSPDVLVKPFDEKLVFLLDNPLASNNYRESYGNADTIKEAERYYDSALVYKLTDQVKYNAFITLWNQVNARVKKYLEISTLAKSNFNKDSFYKFEGYVVYQLKNATTALSSIRNTDGTINPDLARIVYQCDKKNGITNIYNFEKNPELSESYYQTKLMVTGTDNGIKKNFEIKDDLFSTQANKHLVNYKTYYYAVIAYAYNNFADFDQAISDKTQDIQYLESRTNGRGAPIQIIKATPHPAYDNIYTTTNATFGDGIELQRIEGRGNGGYELELTDASVAEALAGPNYHSYFPVYKAGNTPVKLTVIDADSIKAGNYEVWLKVDSTYNQFNKDSSLGARPERTNWFIINTSTSDTIYSEQNIRNYNEQLLNKWGIGGKLDEDWGFAVDMKQQVRPGDQTGSTNKGLINSTILFDDPGLPWLSGVPDMDGCDNPFNWIRAGSNKCVAPFEFGFPLDDYGANPDSAGTFEQLFDATPANKGTWAPYNLMAAENAPSLGIGFHYGLGSDRARNPVQNLPSIDVVMTSDRSKWTRCTVIELNEGAVGGVPNFSEGKALKFSVRRHASVELEPNADGSVRYSTTETGHSWFPGYAINVETGERLNITFGEDSYLTEDNGKDMLFNPTSRLSANNGIVYGGKHIVYISTTKYDAYPGGPDFIYNNIMADDNTPTGGAGKQAAYAKMAWASPALVNQAIMKSWKDGLVPTTCHIRIRVTRPYHKYAPQPGQLLRNNGFPLYAFSTESVAPRLLSDAANPYNNDSKALLDRLNCVPNPYYGYSAYEANRLDTRMKIINLTAVASIKIYSTDGALIKTIEKSDKGTTFIDWDLKNNEGVPVASGMYLIHVKLKTDQGEKERILKWFAIMRPLDLTSF
jgi:hypothetical protein